LVDVHEASSGFEVRPADWIISDVSAQDLQLARDSVINEGVAVLATCSPYGIDSGASRTPEQYAQDFALLYSHAERIFGKKNSENPVPELAFSQDFSSGDGEQANYDRRTNAISIYGACLSDGFCLSEEVTHSQAGIFEEPNVPHELALSFGKSRLDEGLASGDADTIKQGCFYYLSGLNDLATSLNEGARYLNGEYFTDPANLERDNSWMLYSAARGLSQFEACRDRGGRVPYESAFSTSWYNKNSVSIPSVCSAIGLP